MKYRKKLLIISIILIGSIFGFALYQDIRPNPPVTSEAITRNTTPPAPVPTVQPVPEVSKPAPITNPVLLKINAYRASRGLAPLKESAELNRSAKAWADTLARTNYATPHSDFGWEVAAYSCGLFDDVVEAWMNSKAHRNILMSNKFTYIGYGETTRNGCIYYAGQLK